MNPLKLKHLLTVEDLSDEAILTLISNAQGFKHKTRSFSLNKPVFSSNLLFENSTRTHRSFEMAQRKMGIEVIQIEPSTSSTSKGETLYDTVLTLSAIVGDIRNSRVA